MTQAVLADAQFSVVRTFRPFLGFEDVYQGLPVIDRPIAIPGDLDQDAGKPGVSPNLLAGIPVPYGSKLQLWVPTVLADSGESGLFAIPYRYTFLWRLRNLRDFRENRVAYHFPQEGLGENNQFVVPAAQNVSIYESVPKVLLTAPGGFFDKQVLAEQQVVAETLNFPSNLAGVALTPAGASADYQQGLAAATVGSNSTASFNAVQLDALGDELIILISRGDTIPPTGVPAPNWDFTSDDRPLSEFYGTNNGARPVIKAMGLYVMNGSNP